MSTKEKALREQGECSSVLHNHPKAIRPVRQPVRGISAFERLRAEWVCSNPSHTEAELLAACVVFARACGLILREKVLQQQMREVGSYGTK